MALARDWYLCTIKRQNRELDIRLLKIEATVDRLALTDENYGSLVAPADRYRCIVKTGLSSPEYSKWLKETIITANSHLLTAPGCTQ